MVLSWDAVYGGGVALRERKIEVLEFEASLG